MPRRLQQSAFELCTERGYDQTTVAEITARAGLTQRTFFRHFTDKREVLFSGGHLFDAALLGPVDAAAASATALEAVPAGIEAAGAVFPALEVVRHRRALIAAQPELQERELITYAALEASLADALRRRGITDTAADLAAATGVAVLRVAFHRWVTDNAQRPWAAYVTDTVDGLRHRPLRGSVTAHR